MPAWLQQGTSDPNSSLLCMANTRYPKKMSDECVDFIKKALQRDPADRSTAKELIKHPWITIHMVSTALSSPTLAVMH